TSRHTRRTHTVSTRSPSSLKGLTRARALSSPRWPDMKITAVETIVIDDFPNLCYVRVHTDEDVVGLGETFFAAQAVSSWVHEVAAGYLLGKDPLQIDRHW